MPLPPSLLREELHRRHIDMRGYRRSDVCMTSKPISGTPKRARLTLGEKTVPAGAAIHEMSVRLVVDEELTVHDVIAVTDAYASKRAVVTRRWPQHYDGPAGQQSSLV